jgi:hypothetical protein
MAKVMSKVQEKMLERTLQDQLGDKDKTASPPKKKKGASGKASVGGNDLLYCFGGALKIPKFASHLAHFGFSAVGAPVLQTLQPQ